MPEKLSWMCQVEDCELPATRTGKCESHEHAARDKERKKKKAAMKTPAFLQRSAPPKKVSDKRSEQNERYNKRVKEWLVGKKCAVYPHLDATQCHHRAGRQNELLEDETYWLAVSDEGHKFIHANSEWSREKGFMLLRSVTEKPTI